MSEYYIAYMTLAVLIAGFVPAIIASGKERRFSKWYVYGVILLPVAFIHSILLKKPGHRINIYIHDKENPTRRQKKSYRVVSVEKRRITVSPKYIYMVFFTKLIFGAFVALSVFALFRTFVQGTESLKTACMLFAILFSIILSVVELCRFSRLPVIADEITKRALIILSFSAVCSLPMYLLKVYVLDNTLPERYDDFTMFICTLTSLAVFLALILRKQGLYYTFFNKFFDYCGLSLCAYVLFAAITLILMSMSNVRGLVYAVAMPMQLFNLKYFSGVGVIEKLPYIYSSALVHLGIVLILLVSGLWCSSVKKKELEYRVEYRSKAFRMSRKRILRRHILSMDKAGIKPLK